MNCRQFRESYSDFADGLLHEVAEIEARRHLAVCECCRRFDAAFLAGRGALQALPPLSLSRGFGRRLRERLRRDGEEEAPALAQWSGAAGALLVVVVVSLVALEVRSRAEDPAAAASGDTLIVQVPGGSAAPVTVWFADDSMMPLRNPFRPFPAATDSFTAPTITGRFASYAALTSR